MGKGVNPLIALSFGSVRHIKKSKCQTQPFLQRQLNYQAALTDTTHAKGALGRHTGKEEISVDRTHSIGNCQ